MSPIRVAHPAEPEPRRESRQTVRISPVLLWFALVGGVVAWMVQLNMAWSIEELACINGSGPGPGQSIIVYVSIALPWLVAVLALLTALSLRSRLRRAADDVLARERTHLMLVVALVLDVLMVAVITGSGIGLAVLAPCGGAGM